MRIRWLAAAIALLAVGACASTPQSDTAANLALDKPATGSPICKPGEEVEKAFNGRNTSWTHDKFCTLERPGWLQVDLGGTQTVHRFTVRHAGAAGEDVVMNTRAFRISTSLDGRSWLLAADVRGNTDSVSVHDVTPRTARYVRMDVTVPSQRPDDPATRIYELEVR
jgi:hypothetical protein